MKISLTAQHCRIVGVIVLLCGAINLVLYSSAVFSVDTRTEEHTDRSVAAFSADSVDTSTDDDTNNRVFLKSRQPHDKFEVLGSKDHQSFDGNDKVVGVKNRRRKYKYKAFGVKNRKPKGRKRDASTSLNNGKVEHSSHSLSRPAGDEKDGRLKRADTDADRSSPPLRSALEPSKTKQQIMSKKTAVSTKRKSSDGFDIDIVLDLFKGCASEEGEISIDCFNDAYEELSKLFRPLGTIFTFVISEIEEKISILRDYRKDPKVGEHFQTIQSMVQYEVDRHLTIRDDKPSGSRTLLRLHWALAFISELVGKIQNGDNSRKFSEDVIQAYDDTLAKYHPWLMQKAVHVAMYALPDRKELLVKLKMENSEDTVAKFKALTVQLDDIYRVTQQLYASNNLLNLP